MVRSFRKCSSSALAGGALFCAASAALAQTAPLGKGHQWFLDNGLQVMGLIRDPQYSNPFHLSTYQAMDYTAQLWEWNTDPAQLSAMPWGRWVGNPGVMPPQGAESSHMATLSHLSIGDEPNLNDRNPGGVFEQYVNWFNSAHADPTYDDVLLWVNNWGGQISNTNLGDFLAQAQPDMIGNDTYPYPPGAQPWGGSPTNWYSVMRIYREFGKDYNTPVGHYRQTYHSPSGPPTRDPSESELRLLTFGGLTFNSKFLADFTYNTGASAYFNNPAGGDNSPNALYDLAAGVGSTVGINQQARNLGPALVRLKPIDDASYPDQRTTSVMFVRGQHDEGAGPVFNALPPDIHPDTASQAYSDWEFARNDPYLSGFTTVTNLGTKNGGLDGDFIISWFKPLDEWFDGDDWSNQHYMMVMNGLADMNGTAAETRQRILLDFSFGGSGITMLQKVNRDTGAVEDVPLDVVSGKRRWSLELEGGTSELFKFKTGAPFVGTLPPDAIWTNASGGPFQTGGNWDIGGNPSGNYFTHFGSTSGSSPTYSVSFSSNASVVAAFVHKGNVTWNLSSRTFTQSGVAGVDSFIVGMYSGETSSLTITNGTVNTNANPGKFSQIGKAAGATGAVTLGSGAVWNNSPTLLIGRSGNGTLNLNSGSNATFTDVYLAGTPTAGGGVGVMNIAGGTATVSGLLKVWNTPGATAINLSSGTLNVGSLNTNGDPANFNWTGGTLNVTNSTLNIDTAGPLGANVSVSGTKQLKVTGTLAINSGGSVNQTAGTINVGTFQVSGSGNFNRSGGTLIFSSFNQTGGTSSVAHLTGGGSISVTGGTMTAGSIRLPSLTLGGSGTVNITANGTNTAASRVSALSVASTSKLNLNNNDLVIDGGNYNTIQTRVIQGFNNGNWLGNGITSSSAASDSSFVTALGIASNADLDLTEFAGFTDLNGDEVLIKHTYYGDADLGGTVNLDDFNQFLFGYNNGAGGPPAIWLNGDFDYNGSINLDDFNQFLFGLQNQGGALVSPELFAALSDFVTSQGFEVDLSSVPEPGAGILIAAGWMSLLARRQRM